MNRFIKVSDGFIMFTKGTLYNAAISVAFSEIWSQTNHFVKVGNSFIIFTKSTFSNTAIGVS